MSIIRKLKNFPSVRKIDEIDHLQIIKEARENIGTTSYSDRSFAQYYCLVRAYRIPSLKLPFDILLIIPLACLLLYLIFASIKNSIFPKEKYRNELIFVLPSIDIIPSFLLNQKNSLFTNKHNIKSNFQWRDLTFSLTTLNKRLLHPYFSAKCLYKIYKYSGIAKSTANTIYISNEYCFTSSILTSYLNHYGIKVINCMHGEKLLNCRDAFCTYDEFIVWDKHYEKIFLEMHCESSFFISSCSAISIDIGDRDDVRDTIIYFLQGNETEDDLEKIKYNINILKIKYNAKNTLIKEHPRYKTPLVRNKFPTYYFYEGSLSNILTRSLVICGSYTTVLFQVYCSRNRKEYPKIYINSNKSLEKMRYIMLSKADGFFTSVMHQKS